MQKMEQGAYHLYKFVSTSLTWPLMVGEYLTCLSGKEELAISKKETFAGWT
ncbi:MAG: hypothetical protein ACQEWV_28680 [Bacillota bacterium]